MIKIDDKMSSAKETIEELMSDLMTFATFILPEIMVIVEELKEPSKQKADGGMQTFKKIISWVIDNKITDTKLVRKKAVDLLREGVLNDKTISQEKKNYLLEFWMGCLPRRKTTTLKEWLKKWRKRAVKFVDFIRPIIADVRVVVVTRRVFRNEENETEITETVLLDGSKYSYESNQNLKSYQAILENEVKLANIVVITQGKAYLKVYMDFNTKEYDEWLKQYERDNELALYREFKEKKDSLEFKAWLKFQREKRVLRIGK